MRRECLDDTVFDSIADAQAAVDAFVAEYNHDRPHQGIADAYPAHRFRPSLPAEMALPPLKVPVGLLPFPLHRCRRRGRRWTRTR